MEVLENCSVEVSGARNCATWLLPLFSEVLAIVMILPFVGSICSAEPSRRDDERGRKKGLPEDTVQGRMTADKEDEDYRTEGRICRKDSRWREGLPFGRWQDFDR